MSNRQPSLTRLAHLARERSNLLASLLAEYQDLVGLDDAALAMFLRCDAKGLSRLALCSRPRSVPDFRSDVDRIATYIPCDPRQLAILVRAVETRQALRQAPPSRSSMLLAARDRDSARDEEDIAAEQAPDGANIDTGEQLPDG